MKYLFFLLSLILASQIGNAQSRADKKFIRFVISKEHILYAEKIGPYWIEQLKETINQDTLYRYEGFRYYRSKLSDSDWFILTPSEKVFINNELDKMKDLLWKDNVVKKSLALTKARTEKYKKERGGQSYYNLEYFHNRIYAFTKPVFIRNKTVCFFYLQVGGGGQLMIYIKSGKKWLRKFTPLLWVS
ncbi:MAG: hypothetical protein JWR50_2845 [Mucilaginibacter sp.]|nr:hypothetical protein [Mucilaginibacter sp.]